MKNKIILSVRTIWVVSVVVLFSLTLVCGLGFSDEQQQKTVSGTVVDTDWVKSMITVQYSDPYSGNTDEIDIIVPSVAKIMNGTEEKTLSDMGQSDPVTVTYYDDGVSGLKAKRITDLNEGNRDS